MAHADAFECFRGALINPSVDGEGFDTDPDSVVMVDIKRGEVELALPVAQLQRMSAERLRELGLSFDHGDGDGDELSFLDESLPGGQIIMPGGADCHTHMYQPTGLHGEGGLMEWLPKMFDQGEIPAKQDPSIAQEMASERLGALAARGTTRVMAWATSDYFSVTTILDVAKALGLSVQTGFVAMDQNVPYELEVNPATTEQRVRNLALQYPGQISTIDRFPIAVTSALRQRLLTIAREHGLLYEVHCDEAVGEIAETGRLYGGRSIVRVLADDGVFEPGMRVGLAHGIHTTEADRALVGEKIAAGAHVYIRACPSSNHNLKSHITADGEIV